MESRNDFIELLHDSSRRPPKQEPPEPWFPEQAPGALSLLCRAWFNLALSPTRLLNPWLRSAPALTAFARDLLRPEHAVASTRFNTVVSAHRVFDTRRFLRSEFDSISGLATGADLNDAVLAVCAGGLRRYLAAHAELPLAELVATVALALDDGAGRPGGPAAPRRLGLGTHLDDPVERLAWIHTQTSAEAPRDVALNAALPCCTITHVPGPATPVYLHGARLSYCSAILPISDGMGLVFAVTAYDDRIVVSPTSCRELMPDPQAFTQCLRDSFQEYLALARGERPRARARRAAARGSASDKPRPAGPSPRTAAKPLPAEPGGRRRSTAPRR